MYFFFFFFFFFNDTATTEIYTLSLHDAPPICTRPVLGHDPPVRVEARRRQTAEPRQVLEHARNERASLGRQPVRGGAVVEAVARAVRLPQRKVDMPAVARVLRPRLRRQRCDEPVARRHPTQRLAYEQLLVRCPQCGRVRRRDLVLPVPELGVVLLEPDPLVVQRRRELVHV